MPDRILLSRARRGDQEAVAELYRQHVGAALKYARAIAPSNADAEDLVAESFARVIAQLSNDRGPDSSFRAYLFTTMRHRLYSANRREYSVDDETVFDLPVHDRVGDDRAEHDLLKQAFDTLTPQEQEVLLLLEVQELRPTEVCSRLGLRSSALSMRAARARSALAEAYLGAHLQPGRSSECRSTRPLLARHVRGTLSSMRTRHVTDHLGACNSCTEAAAEVADVNRSLRALPIFALPAASPHGLRALLYGFRRGRTRLSRMPGKHLPGHFGLGPAAIKATVVVATLTAGTGAVLAVTAATQHTDPSSGRVLAANTGVPSHHTSDATVPPVPRSAAVSASTSAQRPGATRTPTDQPASQHTSPAMTWPVVSAAPSDTATPSSTGSTPAFSGHTASASGDPTSSVPSSAVPTASGSSSAPTTAVPTSTTTASRSPAPSTSVPTTEDPSPSPSAIPSGSPTSSTPPCDLLDFHCWWVSVFG